MRRLPLAVLALLSLAAAVAPGAARASWNGPCVPGTTVPTCRFWTAKVTFIADGDTIYVTTGGGSRGGVPVRITGIQAMEQTVYSRNPRARRGECGAVAATDRLAQLIAASHGRVRLSEQNVGSRSHGRLLRSVAVRLRGTWRDVGSILLTEGHVLWWPNRTEWAWNGTYSVLSARAAAAHLDLWNSESCGIGPSPHAPLQMWINPRPDGQDDSEWVRIHNPDPVNAVPLTGWWLRDSSLNRFTFPAGATVPAGGTITVYVKPGLDTPGVLHWGLNRQIFDNPTGDERVMGDGAYLFDPLGNLRDWTVYPCRQNCIDPLQGAVELAVQPQEPSEHVAVTNVSAAPIDLEGYRLVRGRDAYAFGSGTVLGPGQTLTVVVGGEPADDTALEKHWFLNHWVLPDRGGAVRLETFTDITVACTAWGSGTC
jgi:endonuclease YncB( thermonuclease family)